MNRKELNEALVRLCGRYRDDLELQERLETCLVKLHRIAVGAASDLAQYVQFLDDEEITTQIAARAAGLDEMAPPVDWDRPGGPQDLSGRALASAIFVELRALDKFLHEFRDKATNADDPSVEFLVRDTGSCLLPLPPVPTLKKSFARSALAHHRILPTEVDGVPIKLYPGPILGRDDDGLRAVAGALFEDFGLRIDPPEGGVPFRVDGVACPRQIQQVDDHFSALRARDRQLAVVWPELTVPPKVREGILERLRNWPLTRGVVRPVLVVPGSWHEDEGPSVVNRCSIHDGFGTLLLRYDKRKMFSLNRRQEGIESGQEIPVLIAGRRLFGFAICLDFCEGMYERAYPRLAVDLFVVPSYGGESTIEAHGAAAADAYLRHGASSFVVQQGADGDPEMGTGYVMARRGPKAKPETPAGNGLSFRTF